MGCFFGSFQYSGSLYYKYGSISDRNINKGAPLKRVVRVLNTYVVPLL